MTEEELYWARKWNVASGEVIDLEIEILEMKHRLEHELALARASSDYWREKYIDANETAEFWLMVSSNTANRAKRFEDLVNK